MQYRPWCHGKSFFGLDIDGEGHDGCNGSRREAGIFVWSSEGSGVVGNELRGPPGGDEGWRSEPDKDKDREGDASDATGAQVSTATIDGEWLKLDERERGTMFAWESLLAYFINPGLSITSLTSISDEPPLLSRLVLGVVGYEEREVVAMDGNHDLCLGCMAASLTW